MKAYLEYYLKQPDLWYDQAGVLAALHCLDAADVATYLASWQACTADKPNHKLEEAIDRMRRGIEMVKQIRTASLL